MRQEWGERRQKGKNIDLRRSFLQKNYALIITRKIPNPRNVISMESDPSINPKAKGMPFAAPEFCHVLPFSKTLYLTSLNLSSLLHQLEACILAHEIASIFLFPQPCHPTWVQALTCSNVNPSMFLLNIKRKKELVLKKYPLRATDTSLLCKKNCVGQPHY